MVDGVARVAKDATTACLLIHGFCAYSDEMGTLGEYLRDNGVSSFALNRPGHSTSPEDLQSVRHEDWTSAVSDGLELVKSWGSRNVLVVGFSLGGALALQCASRDNTLAGCVVISPALWVGGPLANAVPLLKHIVRWRNVDTEAIDRTYGYDVQRTKYGREPMAATDQVLRLAAHIRTFLPTVTVHSWLDRV
ncbi:MAG: alpha/beta fold hydrolase [Candidatus Thorarchaeota archaeon]|nr:alpha/beta fold hydrolase [Candidatus Thorarchaeota archaeon]